MRVSMYPYLVMNGNGEEAITFYEKALEAEVLAVQRFGEMPGSREKPMPDSVKNLILNAHLKVGDTDLMISDNFPGNPYQLGDQVTIAIVFKESDMAREVFSKLEDSGQVIMPVQETFWSPAYGQVKDKFGVTWQVSTEK